MSSSQKEGTTLTGVGSQTRKYQTSYPGSLSAFLADGATGRIRIHREGDRKT